MPTITAAATATSAAAGKKALESVVSDLYGTAKGTLKAKVKRWRAKKKIATLYQKIANVRNVKTIWQIDREVDLLEFYYPSSVKTEDGRHEVKTLADLETGRNVLLEGTVGQGKSILMRYLCSQELYIGNRIPLFAELRRLRAGISLREFLLERLRVLGFNVDEGQFDFLASEGKLVLLLDGFDEVPAPLQGDLVTEIETLAEQYDALRIIVASRPGNPIANSPFFRITRLAEVAREEIPAIIRKLTGGSKMGERLIGALEGDPAGICGVLTTPLMITLLVITYPAYQVLPERLSDFFAQLFEILLSRHDKSKPRFVREKTCALDDAQIPEVFNLLCFLSRKTGHREFSQSEMLKLAKQAILELGLQCKEARYLNDIREVTCLLLREGGQCRFIHNSIQEFHSAAYVRSLRVEGQAARFYSQMLGGAWREWTAELFFLQDIDEYRFKKYFLIPEIENLLRSALGRIPKTWNRTPKTVTDRLLRASEVLVHAAGDKSCVFSSSGTTWWLLRREDRTASLAFSVFRMARLMPHEGRGAHETVAAPAAVVLSKRPAGSPVDLAAHEIVTAALKELTNARDFVASVESRDRLLEF